MSDALARPGHWAAIHRDTVPAAWAAPAHSPRRLNTRSPEAAGICLPLARTGWDPAPARDPRADHHRRRALDRRAGHHAYVGGCAKSLKTSLRLSPDEETPDTTPRTPNTTPEARRREHPKRNAA
jgi:hypothetical protein